METAAAVRDYLRDGVIRNAVNFPSLSPEEFRRLQPWVTVAERLGSLVAQMGEARISTVGVRYYGELARGRTDLLASAVLVGLFRRMLSGGVSPVNAKAIAAERGIEVIESHSSRVRNFTSLMSVKLHTSDGERWVEGTLVEHGGPRLVLVDGVPVEAPLGGTQIVIKNDDQPGVIGAVGTVLGKHGVNIANFALGRSTERRDRRRLGGRRRPGHASGDGRVVRHRRGAIGAGRHAGLNGCCRNGGAEGPPYIQADLKVCPSASAPPHRSCRAGLQPRRSTQRQTPRLVADGIDHVERVLADRDDAVT